MHVLYYYKLGVRDVCRTIGGISICFTKCDRVGGSKFSQNSVTYFMDGLYTVSLRCGILYGILDIVVIQMFRDINCKYMVSFRALPISVFADYADTTYSRLFEQPKTIMRPISCDSFSRIVPFWNKDLLDPLLQCTVCAHMLFCLRSDIHVHVIGGRVKNCKRDN